jgi:hypothetical protein
MPLHGRRETSHYNEMSKKISYVHVKVWDVAKDVIGPAHSINSFASIDKVIQSG